LSAVWVDLQFLHRRASEAHLLIEAAAGLAGDLVQPHASPDGERRRIILRLTEQPSQGAAVKHESYDGKQAA
jgi:hypothetical protein